MKVAVAMDTVVVTVRAMDTRVEVVVVTDFDGDGYSRGDGGKYGGGDRWKSG